MVNRKAVALFVALATIPAIAAWSQYPTEKSIAFEQPVVRTTLVTLPELSITANPPVVVLVKKATRKATRVASATYPKRGWHPMDQGPVLRQVRDL